LEYEDWLDAVETPDTDRLDEKLADNGVGRRLGEGEAELMVALDSPWSASTVDMLGVM